MNLRSPLLAVVVVLSACGGSDGADEASATTTTTHAAASTTSTTVAIVDLTAETTECVDIQDAAMSGLVLNGGPLRDEITNLMDEACVPVIENPGAAPGLAELIKARTTRIAEVQVSIEQNTDLDRGGRMEVMGDAWRESYDLAVELADG